VIVHPIASATARWRYKVIDPIIGKESIQGEHPQILKAEARGSRLAYEEGPDLCMNATL